MRTAKAVGLVLVGIVLGASMTGAGSRIEAKAPPAQAPRVTIMTRVGTADLGNLSFLKDSKSGGCWLYVTRLNGDAAALAVAPKSACD